MKTLSVVAILKNEIDAVADFFTCVGSFADEVIISVDEDSTDGTYEYLAQFFGMTHFNFHLYKESFKPMHFGKMKNRVIDRATMDYVFVADADQRVSSEFKRGLSALLDTNPVAVRCMQKSDWVPHFKDPTIRIFKNHIGIRYYEDIDSTTDEVLLFNGRVAEFPYPIWHLEKRYMKRRLNNWWKASSLDVMKTPKQKSAVRELMRVPLVFFYLFRKLYVRREAWRDGYQGLRYACIRAFYKALIQFYVAFK